MKMYCYEVLFEGHWSFTFNTRDYFIHGDTKSIEHIEHPVIIPVGENKVIFLTERNSSSINNYVIDCSKICIVHQWSVEI